ncbi:tail length tape measure protein [Arthrobacter phage Maja]|uniref:Tape measure protein n=1 Tax=Arthrobacter phage Maja TaxID=2499009 RepID=A0A3S9UN01_9CAUD|nr:tail length tape measure protein [Arthrobacter phage Maja]AZS11714.1 tape measure protein [Arthrobacter phage Maja]
MAQAQDAVWLPVLPSMKGFGPALVKGAGSEADKAGKGVGAKLGTAIVGGVALAGAGLAAAGTALYKVGEVFDDVTDTIRTGTGATGKTLDGLVGIAKSVGTKVPADFSKIGSVVADVNTRMGLSGATLETVASQYLEAGRVLGEDVDVNKTSAAFSAFQIKGDDVSGALDHLFQVSQATGVGMNELADAAAKNAPAMQTLGFSFQETAAMAGSLDKAGLNSSAIMASMSKGLVTLAKDGEKPADAFKRVQGEIAGFIKSGDDAGALNLASKVFGTRGATQFIGAIKSGALNLDNMSKAAGQTGDTILGVGKDTADFAEQWQLFKNRVLVWLEPLGSKVFGALGTAMGEVNGAVMAFGEAWKANDGDITSSGLPGFFEKLAFIAHDVFDRIRVAAAPFVDLFAKTFSTLAPMFAPLIPMLFQVVSAFSPLSIILKALAPVLPQVANLVRILGAVLAGALAKVLPTITGLISSLIGTLSGAFMALMPVVVKLVGALAGMFAQLMPVVAQVIQALAPLIAQLVGALAPIIVNLVSTVLPPVIDAFMAIVGAVAPLVSVILAALIPAIQFLMPIVQVAFAIIAQVIKVAVGIVTGIIVGLIGFIRDVLAPVFLWLYQNVIAPAWAGIQAAVQAVVGWFMNSALPVIQTVIAAVGAVFSWLYNNIVKPVFGFIAGAVNAAWLVISWIFQALVAVVQRVLGPVFNWLWTAVIKPVFDFIGGAISFWWNNIVLPVFNAVWGFLKNTLGPVFDWLWKSAIKPAFDGIGSAIKWVWDNVIKPVFDTLNNFITKTIPKAFENGVGFIKTAWEKLQEIAKAPVRFVVNTVINDGLINGLNGIGGFLGLKPLPRVALPAGFADGGYTGNGGKYEPKGVVHGGEFVFTKEQTSRAGVRNLYAMAKALTGYATGGFVNPLKRMVLTQGWNHVHKGIDLAAEVGTPVYASQDGVVTHAGPGARAPGVWGGQEVHVLGNGIEAWFAHLSRIGVKLGQKVRAGQQIADSGNTGITSGPHLHFGMFRGGWPNDINPLAYLSGAGVPDGKPWNPIADIVNGLLNKFKEAFPAAAYFADLAIGAGKKLLDGAADFVTGRSNDGDAIGAPFLHDQGGVLNPGLSMILNRTRKPEAIYNHEQNQALQALAARGAQGGSGDVIIKGNVGWMPDQVAREIEAEKRRHQVVAGMNGMVMVG